MGIHWLEMAEYITLGVLWVSFLVAIIFNQPWVALVFIPLVLSFSLLNRLRLQAGFSRRIGSAIKQSQQKISEEVKKLEEKIQGKSFPKEQNKSSTASNDPIIAFQQELNSLDQAIKNIIEYLNNHALVERLEYLEQYYNQLRAEITHIGRTMEEINEVNIVLPQTDLSAALVSNYLPSYPKISWQELPPIVAHNQAITTLAISKNSNYLISGSWDQNIKIWSLKNRELLQTIYAHNQGILALALVDLPNKKSYCMATGSFDQNIKLWDLKIKNNQDIKVELKKTMVNHTGSIHALSVTERQKILVSGSYDQTIKQWEIESGKLLVSSFDNLGAIDALALHEARELVVGAGGDGGVTLWKLGTGESLGFLGGNVSSVESLAISPDGENLAAGCADGNIRIWHLKPQVFESNKPVNPELIIPAHAGQVSSVLFTPDGQFLLSSGADGKVKIWLPTIKKPVEILEIEKETRLLTLAISPDGNLLAAGTVNGIIKLWQRS